MSQSIQSQLNDHAFKSLGVDFNKFMNAQDAHYRNQIYNIALHFMCNNSISENASAYENDLYVEKILRTCDAKLRHGDGYKSFSKFHAEQCNTEFDNDENAGYEYTFAHYDAANYEWDIKK